LLTRITFLIIIFCLSYLANAQTASIKDIFGQKYYNEDGDVISILDSSKLISSLHAYGDTANYWIKDDTIFARQEFKVLGSLIENESKIYFYNLSVLSNDQIALISFGIYANKYTGNKRAGLFTNSKLLATDINKFDYVILEKYGPFWGYSKLKIFESGALEFYYDTYSMSLQINYNNIDTAKTKGYKLGKLEEIELLEFKDALNEADVAGKYVSREQKVLDRHDYNITLKANSKFYYSTGNKILPQQRKLFEIHNRLLEKFIVEYKY
jgi:hypothetical protein